MYTHHLDPPFRDRLVWTVGRALLGQGVPEQPNKVLVGECKIGQGYRVWQRSPCLLLLLRMSQQSHMRVISVHQNVHFDTSVSLFSVFAGLCPELIIAKVTPPAHTGAQQELVKGNHSNLLPLHSRSYLHNGVTLHLGIPMA
ncbi:hypothetical protein Y032_0001g370 [Ancylostoma ceylanicum]|uniref:Uncharacterized protein n=1 Tax=Ancylostoma ceylanicum TaxID=53326 RepID=A0A016W5N8_9BILA|nr:hypothetical protein Y032_0001g370 [Ancylostoma ceylanicum]